MKYPCETSRRSVPRATLKNADRLSEIKCEEQRHLEAMVARHGVPPMGEVSYGEVDDPGTPSGSVTLEFRLPYGATSDDSNMTDFDAVRRATEDR